MKQRIYLFDNLKVFLIFSVVLGHLLEYTLTGIDREVYSVIYMFHMPLFIFISGYLSKFSVSRLLNKIIYPYVIFQVILSLLFQKEFLEFLNPTWVMWYMLAMIVWTLIIPIIDRKRNVVKIFILIISIAFGVYVGYLDRDVGLIFSLSRIAVFSPFFILGFYCKKIDIISLLRKNSIRIIFGSITLFVIILIVLFSEDIRVSWFYGTVPYFMRGFTVLHRILIYLVSTAMSVFFISVFPTDRTALSYIGERSVNVYLLHAVILKIVFSVFNIFTLVNIDWMNLLIALALSVIIVYICSTNFVKYKLWWLFEFRWSTKR